MAPVPDSPAMLPAVPGLADLRVLAYGGYATVYRATQASAFREVAVKVENRTLAGERDRERFLHEAQAAGRMSSHPHVVDLIDVGMTEDGHPYMIMELCAGTYADRLPADPLTADEARDVGTKIADALADAHALGVVHGDVKPANILITLFGEPALGDFGLAVLLQTRSTSVSFDMTPAYAAPELFLSGQPVPASDVYGLSATLYALMSGRPPRWGRDRDPSLRSLVDMFEEPVPNLPGVPNEMIDLLRRGLATEPAHRPTAAQMRDELAGVRRDPDPTMIMMMPAHDLPPAPRRHRVDETTEHILAADPDHAA